MSFLIRRPFNSKPVAPRRVDNGHPHLRACRGWWVINEGAGDAIYDACGIAIPLVRVGAVGAWSWNPTPLGPVLTSEVEPNDHFAAEPFDIGAGNKNPFSVEVVGRFRSLINTGGFFSWGVSNLDTNPALGLRHDEGNSRIRVRTTSTWAFEWSPYTPNDLIHVLVTFFPDDGFYGYLNGGNPRYRAQASHAAVTNGLYLGEFGLASCPGDYVSLRVWGRSIEPMEARDIYQNLWAPFSRPVFIGDVGVGPPPVISGTGTLQAQDASVSGVGEVVVPIVTGDGALQAQPATVSGTGDLISAIEGTGALQAQDASVSGVGAIVHDGTGALQAQGAAVVGVGEVGNVRTGTGALQAGDATVVGVGDRAVVGTGALQAQAASVSGVGVTEGLIAGTGALQAQPAAVSGFGVLERIGTGALQAQAASVSGVGFLLGELTLTPADIAAIQNAVWSDPRAVQLINQVNEIWQRRGLDSANPQTYDKAGKQIRVGGITIDLTGNANEVTQTRQP